jgi:hypothetical protein
LIGRPVREAGYDFDRDCNLRAHLPGEMRDHFLGDPTRVSSDACRVQAGCSVEPAKLLNDSLSCIRFLKTGPSLNEAASLSGRCSRRPLGLRSLGLELFARDIRFDEQAGIVGAYDHALSGA